MRRVTAAAVFLFLSCAACPSMAQVTIPEEYDKLIKARTYVGALSVDDVGGKVDLSSGALSIVQTDIDLPGNDSLQVRVGRTFSPGAVTHAKGHFGYFDLDIPYLHGTFHGGVALNGWVVPGANQHARCSMFGPPPAVTVQGGTFDANEFWHGNMLHMPGGAEHEMLLRAPVAAGAPSDGRSYPITTKMGAVAKCLPSLAATSEANAQGEGFEFVTTDGTVYRFDHMVHRRVEPLKKGQSGPVLLTAGLSGPGPVGSPTVAVDYVISRQESFIFPTRVTDRFGNTVTYTWSASNPWRLLRMSASDGRFLDFSYPQGDPDSYQIASVTDGYRTWTYGGSSLTLPDGSKWLYNVNALATYRPQPVGMTCDAYAQVSAPVVTGSITAPSGATVTYTLEQRVFGRSWVQRACLGGPSTSEGHTPEPYVFVGLSVKQRTITGPGLAPAGLTWRYAYGPPNHCWDPVTPAGAGVRCTSASPTTRTVTVTDPDGAINRFTFGNRFRANEGLLLREELGLVGTTALRTVDHEYADPDALPYGPLGGYSLRSSGDYDISGLPHPTRKVVTRQQGKVFTWEVPAGCTAGPYCFDLYARPIKVVKSTSP